MSAKNPKQTGKAVSSMASGTLKDKRASEKSKSIAGSALSQSRPNPNKKKK